MAALLSGVPASLADGCYIPARAVRKIPAIPAQRALVTWKNGVETLVISSALDSESQKLGWIIPLPAVPDKIEKESPGVLKTLTFCIQPRITHDTAPGLAVVIIVAFLANVFLAILLFRRHRFVELLALVVVLGLLAGMLLPALAGARSAVLKGPTTVRLEKTVRAGAYDISVLSAKKAEDLDDWLDENDFTSLPQTAAQTIADYIRKGWVFAAIKLVRDEAGSNSPHPVTMVFKAKEPVYPLKLTAVSGGSTAFELFVVTDEKVSCDLLAEEFCDRFKLVNEGRDSNEDYETRASYQGAETGAKVGHPVICSMMWDDCILTKFSGAIRAAQMTDDLYFPTRSFRAHQRHLYTLAGARETSLMFMAALMGAALFISMIVWENRIREAQAQAWQFGKVILASLVLSAPCALILFIALPKLPASEVQVSNWLRNSRHPMMLRIEIECLFAEHPDLTARTERQIADYLQANVVLARRKARPDGSKAVNQITGGEIQVEDTPGNFTVEKAATNIAIRIYDQTGRPLIWNFPAPGATPSTEARQ